MSEITSPIMLDDTGQDLVTEAQNIVTKLQALINAVKPTAADIPLAAISGMTADDVQEGVAELKSNLTDLNASLTQKTTWVNVINETIGTGSQYDQTLTMTNMPNYTPNEIMFCLMRTSNNRIFASAIVPWGTWQGGAVYACGEFTLYSGQMNTAQIYHVNAVCIQKPNNQCEIAVESLAESIKVRVYVR